MLFWPAQRQIYLFNSCPRFQYGCCARIASTVEISLWCEIALGCKMEERNNICALRVVNMCTESCEYVHWALWICALRAANTCTESCEYVHWELWICALRAVNMCTKSCEYVYWELWICALRAVTWHIFAFYCFHFHFLFNFSHLLNIIVYLFSLYILGTRDIFR
jgi:hypothetical protein